MKIPLLVEMKDEQDEKFLLRQGSVGPTLLFHFSGYVARAKLEKF
jgi:hypothetical protein